MGTDTGLNLLEPGDTPSENLQFLFFCAAVIQAVNKHQALLRASIASAGQDHRLSADEAPPGDHLVPRRRAGEGLLRDRGRQGAGLPNPARSSVWAHPLLPALPMDGGDRNRTSPFAFTGNKFEFRAVARLPRRSIGATPVLNASSRNPLD